MFTKINLVIKLKISTKLHIKMKEWEGTHYHFIAIVISFDWNKFSELLVAMSSILCSGNLISSFHTPMKVRPERSCSDCRDMHFYIGLNLLSDNIFQIPFRSFKIPCTLLSSYNPLPDGVGNVFQLTKVFNFTVAAESSLIMSTSCEPVPLLPFWVGNRACPNLALLSKINK